MPEDNQQQQQPTVDELQAITVNTVKSQFCSLTSFVGIPHDLTYKEDSERLMMGVRRDILNDHLIVCKTLQQCVFKEKYAGEEFHQSMCPFHLLSLICRWNKQYSALMSLNSNNGLCCIFTLTTCSLIIEYGGINH